MNYTINKVNYTIEQAESGWNIFEYTRYPGKDSGQRPSKNFVMHVEGSYEDAHAELLAYASNKKSLLSDIFGGAKPE